MAANDNREPLPSPIQFADLVAACASATLALQEEPKDHDRLVAYEAARMRLIEAYGRAYRGERLRPV